MLDFSGAKRLGISVGKDMNALMIGDKNANSKTVDALAVLDVCDGTAGVPQIVRSE